MRYPYERDLFIRFEFLYGLTELDDPTERGFSFSFLVRSQRSGLGRLKDSFERRLMAGSH